MASSSLINFSLLLALPLALGCKFEVNEPGDTEAGETETSAGDTDGQGTTSGGGGTATTTPGTSLTAGATEPGDGSATDPGDPSAGDTTTTAGTSVGTVGTSIGSASDTIGSASDSIGDTEDPLGPPKPCEGEAMAIGPFPTQIAYLASQNNPEPPDPSGGASSATSTGDPIDPQTLTVRFASQVNTCANPGAFLECGKGDGWSVEIHIPPEFQSPGLYNLAGSDIIAIANEVLDDGADGCGFGGGSMEGSLEILAIDGDQVEGRLCHVQSAFPIDGPELEGTFVAPRCP